MKNYRPTLFVLVTLIVVLLALGSRFDPTLAIAPEAITLTPTEPPTATLEPPTATPVTPTATPITPTATPITPTATPVTPTSTATSTATSIIQPPPPPAATPTPPPTSTPTIFPLPPGPRITAIPPVLLPETGEFPLDLSAIEPAWSSVVGVLLIALAGLAMYVYGMWRFFQRRSWSVVLLVVGTLLFIAAVGLVFLAARIPPVPEVVAIQVGHPAIPLLPGLPTAVSVKLPPARTKIYLPIVSHVSPQVVSTEPQPAADRAITRIAIPSLKVDAQVRTAPFDGQQWDVTDLGKNVALLDHASWPGLSGNTVLAGHITVRNQGNGPFRYLHKLASGATVILYTELNAYTFSVREQRIVDENDLSVIAPSATPQLTLLTCANWDWNSWDYRQRRIVLADLVSVQPVEGSQGN